MSDPSNEHGNHDHGRGDRTDDLHDLVEHPPASETRREASLTLSPEGAATRDELALMDPANRSLAEALRISFRIVQFAMVVLALLFLFSGIESVEEDEEGVRVVLGKQRDASLEPGFHFAAPYPLGEIMKVNTGVNDVLVTAFFPDAANTAANPAQIIETGAGGPLNPARDGSLITSDLNLAHVWLTARYQRVDAGQNLEHIIEADERAMVSAVIQRATVQTIAQTPIDGLLRGEAADIQREIKERAQTALDRIAGEAGGAGIRIERVDLNHRAPPLNLRRRFNAVANARSEGRKARADAESERAKMLNEVAGNAAPSLIEAIDRYEAAIETADGTADGVLSRIDSIMANEDSAGAPLASGAVSEIMSRAENLRFATASNAEADAKLFTAKLDQFRASPALMYRRDRDDALSTFLGKRFVQSVVLPVGGDAQLIINEDPDIQRDLDRQRYKSQAEQAIEDRERARRLDRYQTQRGIQREEN